MNTPVLAINAFPWDLVAEGIDRSLGSIADLGINTLLLSVNYHRARTFHPRHPAHRYIARGVDSLDFEPSRQFYPADISLTIGTELAQTKALLEVRERCAQLRLRFVASLIGCHNTTLGLQYPDLTIENAFGDRYAFALCPANPTVRKYLLGLIADACRHFAPAGLLIDSFAYLHAIHREHHELMFVAPGAVGEHLLSLCFCQHCSEVARESGIDVARLRSTTCSLLDYFVEHESNSACPEFDREEQVALIFEYPELYKLEQMRRQVVKTLFASVKEITQRHGCELNSVTGLLARPSARAWTEGTSLRDLANACDHLYLQAYFDNFACFEQDIRWALGCVPKEKVIVANMVGSTHVRSRADLTARVLFAEEKGAAGISYYNYGLLNGTRLRWIRDANQRFHAARSRSGSQSIV